MGGVCARGSGGIGGVDVCVRGWAAVLGVNNSDDFPNLARSRMWMAALERNCDGFIWLPVCFFIGRREEEWQKRKGGRGGCRGVAAVAFSASSDERRSSEQIILHSSQT